MTLGQRRPTWGLATRGLIDGREICGDTRKLGATRTCGMGRTMGALGGTARICGGALICGDGR